MITCTLLDVRRSYVALVAQKTSAVIRHSLAILDLSLEPAGSQESVNSRQIHRFATYLCLLDWHMAMGMSCDIYDDDDEDDDDDDDIEACGHVVFDYMLCMQVFCSKVSPNCGACPLQTSCDYALSNGKRFHPPPPTTPAAPAQVDPDMPSLQPHVNGHGVHENEHGMQDIARVLWAWREFLLHIVHNACME